MNFSLAAILTLALGQAAWAFQPCLQTGLRLGGDAADLAAMNRAEAQFLGPFAGLGTGSGGQLAQGTEVVILAGPELAAGLCGGSERAEIRIMAHLRPISADMPQGIGIFTDPATLRGMTQGLRAEAYHWTAAAGPGGMRAGLGLGLEADWTRLHLNSAFIDLDSRDFAMVVPVTLQLQWPMRQGAVDLWLRRSWSQGLWGTSLGLGYAMQF